MDNYSALCVTHCVLCVLNLLPQKTRRVTQGTQKIKKNEEDNN